jgi:hypothetical protein
LFWEGGLPFAVAPARDVTDRNGAEAALREREERFRGTFENAAVGIGHRHLGGHFLCVNQKFCSILGYSRDQLLPRTGPEITYPDDLAAGVEMAEALLRGESPGFAAGVPEHLAALRDALRDQDAPRLREVAHKCGMLSEFSAAADDLAGTLEELAAVTQLDTAGPILEQLEAIAQELVNQVVRITIEALRRRAEGMDEYSGTAGSLKGPLTGVSSGRRTCARWRAPSLR